MIIESQPAETLLHQIVLVLGGFHTELSFLCTIEMAGTVCKEIISQVYADGSVDQLCQEIQYHEVCEPIFWWTVPLMPSPPLHAFGLDTPNVSTDQPAEQERSIR